MFLEAEVFSARAADWMVLKCADRKTVRMAKNKVMSDGSLRGQQELVGAGAC